MCDAIPCANANQVFRGIDANDGFDDCTCQCSADACPGNQVRNGLPACDCYCPNRDQMIADNALLGNNKVYDETTCSLVCPPYAEWTVNTCSGNQVPNLDTCLCECGAVSCGPNEVETGFPSCGCECTSEPCEWPAQVRGVTLAQNMSLGQVRASENCECYCPNKEE